MFNKYIFSPAFDDAIAITQNTRDASIPGQDKMKFHLKLRGRYWRFHVKRALQLQDDIPNDQFDKIRHKKTSLPIMKTMYMDSLVN